MKFSTHHFPQGTVVRVSDELRHMAGQEFTVQSLVQNGVDSYVIVTTQNQDRVSTFGPDYRDRVSFNIAWVSEILKRGSGQVIIDHSWYGTGHLTKASEAKFKKEIDMMRLQKETMGIPLRKGYHHTGSIRTYLAFEVARMATPGSAVDLNRMIHALHDQAWFVHDRRIKFCPFFSVNKKRLKKWLRANINRFLERKSSALKAEKKQQEKDYKKDTEDLCSDVYDDVSRGRALEGSEYDDVGDYPKESHYDDDYSEDRTQDYESLMRSINRDQQEDTEVEQEDDSESFYTEDDFEDRNLTLPPSFITNFRLDEFPLYEEAVKRACKGRFKPEWFDVRKTDADGKAWSGSFWYHAGGDLSDFWEIFEQVKSEFDFDTGTWRTVNPSVL